VNIQELMLYEDDEGSNEYKEGWCNAVCYINDCFIIKKRNGEAISIEFDISLDEDELIKKVTKAVGDE